MEEKFFRLVIGYMVKHGDVIDADQANQLLLEFEAKKADSVQGKLALHLEASGGKLEGATDQGKK